MPNDIPIYTIPADQFLRNFMNEIINKPLDRLGILTRYTELLEQRDQENRSAESDIDPEEEQ